MTQDASKTERGASFFLEKNAGIAHVCPEDDFLHPASFQGIADETATETQYFGFNVPEESINGVCYMWHHPNLRVVTGGVLVYRGVKNTMVHAELCDWRTFMSDGPLKKDPREYRLANGYGVRILEPNSRFHITYTDVTRGNSLDLIAEGVLPAVMWGGGNHFDQTMKVNGTLVLRGKTYGVRCFNVRDRSWGTARSESQMPLPPMSWMVGTYREDFSFNCTMFDQTRNNPRLKGSLAALGDNALLGGWVYQDGRVGRIIEGTKRVTRNPQSLAATLIELSFSDECGRHFEMRATLLAAIPVQYWNNLVTVVNLLRWECNGLIGYGDAQEAFWSDYLNS